MWQHLTYKLSPSYLLQRASPPWGWSHGLLKFLKQFLLLQISIFKLQKLPSLNILQVIFLWELMLNLVLSWSSPLPLCFCKRFVLPFLLVLASPWSTPPSLFLHWLLGLGLFNLLLEVWIMDFSLLGFHFGLFRLKCVIGYNICLLFGFLLVFMVCFTCNGLGFLLNFFAFLLYKNIRTCAILILGYFYSLFRGFVDLWFWDIFNFCL